MATILIPTITQAGISAAMLANNQSVAFNITHISFGNSKFNPTGRETHLPGERLKTTIHSANKLSHNSVKIRANVRGNSESFNCMSIGLWSGNTLFAVHSSASLAAQGLFNIHPSVETIVSMTISLTQLPANNLQVQIDQTVDKALTMLEAHVREDNPHPQYKPQNASTAAKGIVQLNDTLTSQSREQALTANQGKVLKDLIDGKIGVNDIQDATTSRKGVAQLSSEINSNDETKAATPKAVKTAYDKAVDAEKKALPLGAVIAFPKEITHPTGFLKCNGTTFNQQTYPDLYRALGNKNKLPDLGRSDVGQLAYFPTDTIPDGWLACDGKTISQTAYPELYRYLGDKYGAHGKLPNAEDRFIRNAGAGLRVGQVQADEFKAHHHRQPLGYPAGSRELSVVDEQWEKTGQIDQNMPIVLSKDSNPGDNRWAYSKFNHDKEGGAETRPKSIVFKLCIKAKNSFDDVQFWIKAFGEVQNVGAMDASRLGQDIQALRADKADRNHSHTAAQITDFAQSVARQFSYQKIGDHEVWKFPDGTMHQVLRFHSATGFTTNWQLRHQLVFPVAFRQTPKCFASLASEQGTFTNGQEDSNKNYHQAVTLNSFLKFNYGDSSGAKLLFWACNPDGYGNREPETWHILAIGRWK